MLATRDCVSWEQSGVCALGWEVGHRLLWLCRVSRSGGLSCVWTCESWGLDIASDFEMLSDGSLGIEEVWNQDGNECRYMELVEAEWMNEWIGDLERFVSIMFKWGMDEFVKRGEPLPMHTVLYCVELDCISCSCQPHLLVKLQWELSNTSINHQRAS